MKTILVTLLATLLSISFVQAQNTTQVPQGIDSLQNKVMKLMQFYDSYDDGSPESLKKAKYNDAVDEISEGTATQSDKDAAYKIIDAYIKGDKALENDKPEQNTNEQSFDDAIENSKEVQEALKFVEQQKTILTQMSYPDFETYVLNANPLAGKKEIKTAYNAMHKTDGKQVTVTPADEEMTEMQKQVWAFGILENPKNYEEFRKACKILNPKFSDTEIRKVWENRDK
jgi:hypothetical protein